jgi:hypothetical protein
MLDVMQMYVCGLLVIIIVNPAHVDGHDIDTACYYYYKLGASASGHNTQQETGQLLYVFAYCIVFCFLLYHR